jgi:hypothetical protein
LGSVFRLSVFRLGVDLSAMSETPHAFDLLKFAQLDRLAHFNIAQRHIHFIITQCKLATSVWQTSVRALDRCRLAIALTDLVTGAGFNDKGKKTLAHPDYQLIQGLWHPTRNLGKAPGNFTQKSKQRVWLRCPGCLHECGRQHEWEARIFNLTQHGGHTFCPYCISKNKKFCPCRSVESDPRLSKEWHFSNPPANQVAKSSNEKYLWLCLEGHPPYKATCLSRCTLNSGCPECGAEKSRTTCHPVVSVGRPDLAEKWDFERNDKLPSEVTLGSHYRAWWVCSNPEHSGWQAVVKNRALQGGGCPACMYRFRHRQFGAGI